MLTDTIHDYIKSNLSKKRYMHTLGVAEEAERLAKRYGADTKKAYFAGLAHDLAKEIPEIELKLKLKTLGKEELLDYYSYPLLHGPAAAAILEKEFSVEDKEILDAVHYHTTGKEDMGILTKIIYLADFIEPNRNFTGVKEAREAAEESLDKGIIVASGMVIIHTVRRGKEIHPDTVLARNYLLKENGEVKLDF